MKRGSGTLVFTQASELEALDLARKYFSGWKELSYGPEDSSSSISEGVGVELTKKSRIEDNNVLCCYILAHFTDQKNRSGWLLNLAVKRLSPILLSLSSPTNGHSLLICTSWREGRWPVAGQWTSSRNI